MLQVARPSLYMPPKGLLVPEKPRLAMPMLGSRGARAAKGFGFTNRSAPAITISMQASTSNYDSTTIVIPAGAGIGDIAVLLDMAFDIGATPPNTTPTGWTAIGTSLTTTGIATIRQNTSFKVLIAGDPGSSITGMTTTSQTTGKVMYVFRKTSGTWQTPASVNGQATTGNPTLQTVTAGTAPYFVIGGFSSANTNGIGLPGDEGLSSSNGNLGVSDGAVFISKMFYKLVNSGPSSITADMGAVDDCGAMRSFRVAAA